MSVNVYLTARKVLNHFCRMHFLHLEDSDSDAELFAAMLLREWPECRITRMWRKGEFEAALQLENFDLILSDYSMPGFNGLSALDIARKWCSETPFVFLSGTIGEERAIEALRLGALDYVLKEAPARLYSAIRSALLHGEREGAKRRAEEALRKSREQFQQIAENIDDFIVLLDGNGHCLYSNPSFRRLLRSGGASSKRNIFEEVHPGDRERFRHFVNEALQRSGAKSIEYRLLLPGDVIRHIEARASLPGHRDDEAPTLLLAGRDVTDRKAAEELLHEQASLLDKARDAICVIDLQFTVTQWNASAERIFRRTAANALGRNFREMLFAEQAGRFDTAFALTLAEGEWHGEFRLSGPEGNHLVVDSSWSLVNDARGQTKSILCIITDVTSRRMLELELQRSQRIESLGMLAGGIAHDLNNILSPILMSIGLLRPIDASEDCQMVLDAVQTSATHGCELVQQILLFARGGEGQRITVQMGQFLGELRGFLKTALRRAIELHIEHDPEIWSISADATQIKQVLLNLCVNARDAMPRGGSIRITASNVHITGGTQRGFHGEIPTGSYVRLNVADTGTGIPSEVIEKIFDPFFTTKELGKGTGLGLSTIAGIVQTHGGAIQVQSVIGSGTVFSIFLPAIIAPAIRQPQISAENLPRGRGEVILIIDDDEGILNVAEKILAMQGYEVMIASGGNSGLKEFRSQRDRIQLVICDQMMPGLTGSAVLAQIHDEAPQVKLIRMSGFFEDSPNTEAAAYFIALPKPIQSEILLRTVRRAIDAPASALANCG
jgi:PAS domain S-box-containing protein